MLYALSAAPPGQQQVLRPIVSSPVLILSWPHCAPEMPVELSTC
jgi:hypothetical protein